MLAKVWKYTWNVVYNLISIGIMFALFNSAKTTFETCVIYMLVTIYLTASSRSFVLVMADFVAYKGNHKLLIEIAEKVGIETADLRETLKNDEKAIEGGTQYLDMIFTSIKHLIAIAILLNSLLG